MAYDPKIHPFDQAQGRHRRSIRLKGYDYTQPGAYFVTLVTYRRDEIFGEVVNGVMRLSALGQIVHDEWMRSIGIRKEIRLFEDEFVVMPNHAHGIVWIVETVEIVGADGVRPIIRPGDEGGARHAPQPVAPQPVAPQPVAPQPVAPQPVAPQPTAPQPLRRAPKSLGSFIAGFKASVSSRAKRELNMTGIWQRNYYEHIIRNEIEFKNIWDYIDDNPRKWEDDQLHPKAPPNKFNQNGDDA